jgi:predicted HicB family RNase H-like nuclease
MRARSSPERTAQITFKVTPALRAALEVEAWESSQTLNDYIRGLLDRRGKWARSVGKAGHYDIGPEKS